MSLMLNHQALCGFLRNLALALPDRISNVHFTSALVKGLPSCHLTPPRNWNVRVRPSSVNVHDVARSGTTLSIRFCGLSGSNTTRLLNTAMNGISVEIVASSSTEALGGLSRCVMRTVPPCFWADAATVEATRPASANHRRDRGIDVFPSGILGTGGTLANDRRGGNDIGPSLRHSFGKPIIDVHWQSRLTP